MKTLVLSVLFSLFFSPVFAENSLAPYIKIKGTVTSISDGDTLKFALDPSQKKVAEYFYYHEDFRVRRATRRQSKDVNNVVLTVRFLLMDTPESNFRRKGQGPLGELAKKQLLKMINVGDDIVVRTGPYPHGIYGRVLGEVFTADEKKNVNLELVKKGWAFPFFYATTEEAKVATYLKAADHAIHKNRGLFSKKYINHPQNKVPHEWRMELTRKPEAPFFAADATAKPLQIQKLESLDDFYADGLLGLDDRSDAVFKKRIRRIFFSSEESFSQAFQ